MSPGRRNAFTDNFGDRNSNFRFSYDRKTWNKHRANRCFRGNSFRGPFLALHEEPVLSWSEDTEGARLFPDMVVGFECFFALKNRQDASALAPLRKDSNGIS